MSKKKQSVIRPRTHEIRDVTAPPSDRQQRKRRYYRRATWLHFFTLVTCFSLFILFSMKLATQSLMEMQPVQAQGWFLESDPVSGKLERREFSLKGQPLLTLAELIDSTPSVYASSKLEKYGEIHFKFAATKRIRKFFLSQDGIRDSQGWNRHKALSPDEIRKILKQEPGQN